MGGESWGARPPGVKGQSNGHSARVSERIHRCVPIPKLAYASMAWSLHNHAQLGPCGVYIMRENGM